MGTDWDVLQATQTMHAERLFDIMANTLTREELDKFTHTRAYHGPYRECEYPGCVDGAEVKVYRWHLARGEHKVVSSLACHMHGGI